MRKALHLCVGARVMLGVNKIWGVSTVPLGLMNGARGVIVAILYAARDTERVDGNALAGCGYPSSPSSASDGRLPRGPQECPLPDYVVVHFPGYTGPALFEGLPRTWVPIPSVEIFHHTIKGLVRVGLPLRLAWALTIHKSHGITAEEGTIISFEGAHALHAVSKLGLAFVGWTRATKWAKVAFHKLPPLEDFVSIRLSREFEARSAFELKADMMFTAFLQKRDSSAEQLLKAHLAHFKATVMALENHPASEPQLQDLTAMLDVRGVAPVSESVKKWSEMKTGRRTEGLWGFVASFRADKQRKQPRSEKPKIQRKEASNTQEEATSQENAAELMMSLGFRVEDITVALEQTSMSFPKALTLLLNGMDEQRAKYDAQLRFRRHVAQTVRSIDSKQLASLSVRAQYQRRAKDDLGLDVRVLDFGQQAGDTTGACFWLCLVAGLAHCAADLVAQALPSLPEAQALLQNVRALALANMAPDDIGRSALGLCAAKIRTYFCDGADAALLRHDMQERIYSAYACLNSKGPARTRERYRQWVQKLATREYADELVIVVVALELQIPIICIPYTAAKAITP